MTAPSDLRASCAALMEGVRASAADPADAVRMLVTIVLAPPPALSPYPSVAAAQGAVAAMMRRCALVSLGRACASFNPASSTEAAALRAEVVTLFDGEIVAAADAGSTATFRALRALRTRVAADLLARGTALPALVTVVLPEPEPSLAVAWRLYGDVRREPGMVARAGVRNPLFMPTSFEGLSA